MLSTVLILPANAPQKRTTLDITRKDFKCLVDNVYHESRSESFHGQVLVARVTLNRTVNGNVCAAVYAYKQFSWTLDKHKRVADRRAWECAAKAAIAGIETKNDLKYFHTKHITPAWAKHKQRMVVEGNHIFYK